MQFIHPSPQIGKLRQFYATSSKAELRKMQEHSDFSKWPGITFPVCHKMLIILSNLNENALKYRPAGGWEQAILVPHPDLSFSKPGTTLSWSAANKMSQPWFCDTPSGDMGDTSFFSVWKKDRRDCSDTMTAWGWGWRDNINVGCNKFRKTGRTW